MGIKVGDKVSVSRRGMYSGRSILHFIKSGAVCEVTHVTPHRVDVQGPDMDSGVMLDQTVHPCQLKLAKQANAKRR